MIATEILSAHLYQVHSEPFIGNLLKLGIGISAGAWILLAGYTLGLSSFGNIWVLSAVSITSILLFEPIIAYQITGQLPTPSALVGFAFGAIGLVITLLW